MVRIGCWSVALPGGTALFWMCRFALQVSWKAGNNANDPLLVGIVFLATVLTALPVWLLLLPLVVGLRNPGAFRAGFLLIAASLAGPVTIAGYNWLVRSIPEDRPRWFGDPLIAAGPYQGMDLAAGVGLCCAVCYLAALRYVNKDLGQNF